VQRVMAPAKEGQAPRVKTSSGSFEFARPDRFRFNYSKPFEQVIVADGQSLWLHDVDLQQVTQRRQGQVLASTPAAIIIQATNLDALRAQYVLGNLPDADGLSWVLAEPKAKEGPIQRIRVGFKAGAAAPTLAALEFTDSFGQTSRMVFSDVQINPALPSERFRFTPPAGVGVVKQ
jgi:outer membrane lipoprotein carrier protein